MNENIQKLYFEDIKIGARQTSSRRTITEADIVNFACLTGDFNPLHMDKEFAQSTIFGQRIAHGLLGLAICAGLKSNGPEYHIEAFMNLSWAFKRPIFIGDTVSVISEVIDKKDARSQNSGIVISQRKLINQNQKTVHQGTFQLMVARKPDQAIRA